MQTIRVISYVGDLDDADEVIIIGPYDAEMERDGEVKRLSALSALRGMYEFEASDIPVGLRSVTSVAAAKVFAMTAATLAANDDAFGEIIWSR